MNRREAAIELHRSWKALFLDDAGQMKPEALTVMRDLEAHCFQTRSTAQVSATGQVDAVQMAINEGRRAAYLFVRGRIFADLAEMVKRAERMSDD